MYNPNATIKLASVFFDTDIVVAAMGGESTAPAIPLLTNIAAQLKNTPHSEYALSFLTAADSLSKLLQQVGADVFRDPDKLKPETALLFYKKDNNVMFLSPQIRQQENADDSDSFQMRGSLIMPGGGDEIPVAYIEKRVKAPNSAAYQIQLEVRGGWLFWPYKPAAKKMKELPPGKIYRFTRLNEVESQYGVSYTINVWDENDKYLGVFWGNASVSAYCAESESGYCFIAEGKPHNKIFVSGQRETLTIAPASATNAIIAMFSNKSSLPGARAVLPPQPPQPEDDITF